jgi:hypothetical protein
MAIQEMNRDAEMHLADCQEALYSLHVCGANCRMPCRAGFSVH